MVIPKEVMELGCLLPFEGEGFYPASLSEPLSCVIGAMHANYHTTPGSYIHQMEIVENGKNNPVYTELDAICNKYQGLWSVEAETYLLKNAEGLN